jgi:hypothetical protein
VSFDERLCAQTDSSGKRLATINDGICPDDSHHTCKTANPKNLATFFDDEVNVTDNALKSTQYYTEGHVKGATDGKISPTGSHRSH